MMDFIKKSLKIFTVLILIILADEGFAQAPRAREVPQDTQGFIAMPFSSNVVDDANTINFRKINNAIIIKVIIDGKGPYNFLLDTGMSTSYISEHLAQELELQHLLGS